MTPTNEETHAYVLYIAASPERVWRALLDPEHTRAYWKHENRSDWRRGSRWEHVSADDARTVRVVGEVLDVEPGDHLVVSWSDPNEPGARPSRVTYELARIQDMTCLSVRHEALTRGGAMATKVKHGWPRVLSSLKSYLETGRALDTWAGATVRCEGA